VSSSSRSAFDTESSSGQFSKEINDVDVEDEPLVGYEDEDEMLSTLSHVISESEREDDLIDRIGIGLCPVFFQYRENTERLLLQ